MQQSVLYANADIAMQISKFLLTREKIRTLAAASNVDEVKSILATCGYKTDFATDDEIIEHERAKTIHTAIELSTDDAVTNCLQILSDRHKIREDISKKANLTSFEIDTLCEIELFKELSPHIDKIKNKNIKNYFTALADLTNIKTFTKYKLANVKPTNVFVSGGMIGVPLLTNAFGGDNETLKSLFSSTPYFNVYTALVKALGENDINILETAISRHLDGVVATDKDNLFQPNLLFWWFVKKQTEFIVVKTVMMNKRLNLPQTTLQESLRGLYERFN
ncbi:MAG: V-type ATPase subunit [Christensenellaceae bacterium]|jgi:vacuolar-type H+-ATPase subunit C/Vma6|nr:V-type ATPase subunit [Christensenellaceae bacterium]